MSLPLKPFITTSGATCRGPGTRRVWGSSVPPIDWQGYTVQRGDDARHACIGTSRSSPQAGDPAGGAKGYHALRMGSRSVLTPALSCTWQAATRPTTRHVWVARARATHLERVGRHTWACRRRLHVADQRVAAHTEGERGALRGSRPRGGGLAPARQGRAGGDGGHSWHQDAAFGVGVWRSSRAQ